MRNVFTSAALAAALFVCTACDAPSGTPVPIQFLTFEGETMGTTYSVRVSEPPPEYANHPEKLGAIIEAELAHVDEHMSTYRADSDLSLFNQHADTSPFALPPAVMAVFERAMAVSEESDGAFDVTVGPLVNVWGFGPNGRPDSPPTDAAIAELRGRIGYRMLTIDTYASTIAKGDPKIYCDLSAIAKGWASDQVANALAAAGCDDYMVEVGGEVQTRGKNADGVPWRIAIETPVEGQRAVYAIASLSGVGMATSGDYRNFYDADGTRLSHTIDPRTGKPIAHSLASVSVVHAECAMADAYATALMVMGAEEGHRWATAQGIAAFFITREPDGTMKHRATDAFASYLAEVVAPDAAP